MLENYEKPKRPSNIPLVEQGNTVYYIFMYWGLGMLMFSSGILAVLDYFKQTVGKYSLEPTSSYTFAGVFP